MLQTQNTTESAQQVLNSVLVNKAQAHKLEVIAIASTKIISTEKGS